jgi:hypothetical protein
MSTPKDASLYQKKKKNKKEDRATAPIVRYATNLRSSLRKVRLALPSQGMAVLIFAVLHCAVDVAM